MDLGLEGKVAVLTGGGRKNGIGWATVAELVSAGAKVVMGDIEVDPGYAEFDGVVVTHKVDLSKRGGPESLVKVAAERFGAIDILVNNLGATNFRKGFAETSDDDWEFTFNTNFMSSVRACRAAMPHLLESRGVIVNLSSGAGLVPIPTLPDYSVFKSATLSLTRLLSEEYNSRGLRVVSVLPGAALTPHWTRPGGTFEMFSKALGSDVEQLKKDLPRMFGMTTGRMVEPEEIAAAVVFAASSRAASMTGTQILVDGGAVKTI